jgi:hypothetical protein
VTRGRRILLAAVMVTVAAGTALAQEPAAPPAAPAEPDPPAAAPPPPEAAPATAPHGAARFSAYIGGALVVANSPFHAELRFTEFAEEGRLDADYARGLGPGFELGLAFAPRPRFAVSVHFNALSRDASNDYEAALPHPLFLGQPRRVTGTLDGFSYTERTVHLDLAWRGGGKVRYALFAGPTYANATAELAQRVQYAQTYPFDTVQVTSVTRGALGGDGFGFNVGGELGYQASSRAAATLLVRYHRATVELNDAAGEVELRAGGLQIGAGLRFFF